ncbi:MAG: hypothetical protein IKX85_00885, partial [Clostridia bacterium]|nr:hypothetical protein [Clostridia bacterium]
HAAGASKGFSSTTGLYGRVYGNTHITVDGTAVILGGLYAGGEMPSAFQFGDAYVAVKGGTVKGAVYMVTEGGFGGNTYTSRLTVTGGNISISSVQVRASQLTSDGKPRYNPQTVVLDLSNASTANVSALRNFASGFDAVYMPASSVTRAALANQVAKTVYYEGETFDPSGLVASLTANSRKYSAPYDESVSTFSFVPSLTTPLTSADVSVSAYYGANLIATIPITVEAGPSVRMEGAMIQLVGEKQTLRFVATLEGINTYTVKEYGIVCIPSDGFTETSIDLVGGRRINCTGTVPINIVPESFGLKYYYGDIKNIPVEEYPLAYAAFAYVVFQKDGALVTVTSSPITRSVEEVARAAVSMGKESESSVEKLNGNVIRAVEEGWTSSYDAEEVEYRTAKIIDNLYTMSSLKWYCPVDMNFSDDTSFTGSLKYKAGTTYTGMPYIAGTNGYASYNQWNALYPNGATYTGATGWNTMLGNMCSSAQTRAWEPVISTKCGTIAESLLKKDEFILVGQCVVPDYYQRTKDVVNANLIISAENADDIAQRVYENYAQARRGDYLYSTWVSRGGDWLGHIRMIDSTHPVRNDDGTISGSKSYLVTYEQCSSLNTTLKSTWRMQYKYPYQDLCNRSLTSTSSAKYLAIRPTVHATSYYPTPALMLKDRNTPENVGNGLRGTASSNYYIYEAHLVITDVISGNVTLSLDDYPYRKNSYE